MTPLVREALLMSNAIVLESNHDLDMLWDCSYSWVLKQRIASSHGHLDNPSAARLLAELLHPDLQVVVLGHISENSNTPQQALQTLLQALDTKALPQVVCASPYECTELFDLSLPAAMAIAV